MEFEDLKSLIFVVIALLAWIAQALFKRKEQQSRMRDAGAARRERIARGTEAGEAEGPRPAALDEPDVIYGRQRLPSHYAKMERPAPAQPPAPRGRAKAPPPPPPRSEVASTLGDRPLGTLQNRQLETRLASHMDTAAAATVHGRGGRLVAARRLGLRRMGGVRAALRAGILWGEVLGPPRALRGPHRAPSSSRRVPAAR